MIIIGQNVEIEITLGLDAKCIKLFLSILAMDNMKAKTATVYPIFA